MTGVHNVTVLGKEAKRGYMGDRRLQSASTAEVSSETDAAETAAETTAAETAAATDMETRCGPCMPFEGWIEDSTIIWLDPSALNYIT